MSAPELDTISGDRFDIDRPAGKGGMGTVYRALDLSTGDWVALKILHAAPGDAAGAERFSREARLLSELSHPGIVRYIAHGTRADGQRFLAMEWLDGEDLAARLARGPMLLGECLSLLQRAAEALEVAHRRGVVHRDLKPGNIFLVGGEASALKLLDFGIARRLTSTQALTATGALLGTPDYMAPEQALADREVTPAADIFSLGCIFYECLTGRPPFAAERVAAVLARILFSEPRPVAELRPGVPAEIVALLRRMLVKDPALRIADATALRAALKAMQDAPAVTAAPTLEGQASSFGEREQGLFHLVIASPPRASIDAHTMSQEEAASDAARLGALRSSVQGMTTRADELADGSLVLTAHGSGSATDQAAQAARAALLVKERWPAADVVMATGRGALQGSRAAGEVVDRAERLLAIASGGRAADLPSGVRVDDLSARLLEARFSLARMGELTVLTGEERDADATRLLLGKPTPCVGREAELGSLLAELQSSVDDSETRAVVVTGPPGIGKSRLRHELLRRIAERQDPVSVLVGRGDLTSAGTPYGILRQTLRRLCGIAGAEPLAEQQARLLARAAGASDPPRVAAFLGEIAAVPFDEEHSALLGAARQDPKIMRDQVRAAFVEWLRAECQSQPVMLVLDDLQWADALTVGLIEQTLRELPNAPLLVLALARPEVADVFPKLWHGHKLHRISLRGLGRRACERLVQKVLGEQASPETTARIFEQSAGNALFLEELIRAAAELRGGARPETVVAMVQTRIGRFEPGPRRALRAASVFGQIFWRGGVAAILGFSKTAPEIDAWLDALTDEEVIQTHTESRLREERQYSFRHALVREAAQGLLTEADLTVGHRLAGAYLEAAGETDPLVIAEHHDRGGEKARAVTFYRRAAARAFEECDLEGTLRCVEQGIACGAEGEARGALRAVESRALQWMDRMDRCQQSAEEAMVLLRPGSRPWSNSAWLAGLLAASGPPELRARAPALIDLYARTEPEPDARSAHAEGLGWMTVALSVALPRDRLQLLVDRLEAISNLAAEKSPAALRWIKFARSHIAWHCEPRPWTTLKLSEESVEAAQRAGDLRTVLFIQAHELEMTRFELGDAEGALSGLRALRRLPGLEQDTFVKGAVAQHIASILVRSGDPAALGEAEELAAGMIDLSSSHPINVGLANENLARVKLRRGEPAEADARRACAILEAMPLYGLGATVVLASVMLAQGRAAEAASVAERGLAVIERYGGAGCAEVEMRLCASEAFHAAGDLDKARAALLETERQIALRAADIEDPAWRARYLRDNPVNARAAELAAAWLRGGPA